MSDFTKSAAYPWALTGIFAAFHLVLTFIPYSVLGMGGGFLTWGMVSAPIVGFLLGPFYGPIAACIGSFIGAGIFNPGGILGPIVPIFAPTFGAFAAGSLRTGRSRELFILFLLAILGYVFSPIGIDAFVFLWLHIVTLVVIAILLIPSLLNRLSEATTFEKGRNAMLMPIAIFLFSFIAVLSDHIVGSSLAVYWYTYVLGVDAATLVTGFVSLAVVYPAERIVAAIVLAAAMIAIEEAIVQTGLELPTSPWDRVEQRELTREEIENS
ncbi:MAG: hypothetical protein ACFFER_20410 [Candidatus Thorarchaeota archaeon]